MISFVHCRFYAAGFILYYPSDDPYWRWTPSHGQILIITVMFIWLGLLSCAFFFLQSTVVWFILKRRYRDLHDYGVLNEDDDELDDETNLEIRNHHSNNHALKSLKPTNGQATINVEHQNELDSESEIEFDQRRPHSSKI